MGTPDFAVPSLRSLADTHEVVAAYSRPDARSRRGNRLHPSPVKEYALERRIPVHTPDTLRDQAVLDELADLAPDIICVAAYGLILPQSVLDLPRLDCINVHASLLPRWRGAAPIHRAILAGDPLTGVSIMRMDAGLDTGDVAATTAVPIGDENVHTLSSVLAATGAELLCETLPEIARGTVRWKPQPSEGVTYAQKVTRDDVVISPGTPTDVALRRVRASDASVPVRITVGGRSMTVLEARVSPLALGPAGVLTSTEGVHLGLSDGAMLVTQLKPDGGRGQDAASWSRGARLNADSTWEASS